MTPFEGKHFLITGGSPRENIDGVRHFLNQGRDQEHAIRTARALIGLGARVTLVTAKSPSLPNSSGFEMIETVGDRRILSSEDLIAACDLQAASQYDAVVQLANIPGFVSATPSEQKLKLKSDPNDAVPLNVRGNIDVLARLRRMFPRTPVVGYDNLQKWMDSDGNSVSEAIKAVADQHQHDHPPREHVSLNENARLKFNGRTAVVTSGPTVEDLTQTGDVITNFSSGRQGHAVAQALATMGIDVTLVTGPTLLSVPDRSVIRVIEARSAQEMHDEVMAALPADIFVGVAAVADFRPLVPLSLSLTEGEVYTLQLRQNPDILQAVGNLKSLRPLVVVGFAAETNNLLTYARGKLESKGRRGRRGVDRRRF